MANVGFYNVATLLQTARAPRQLNTRTFERAIRMRRGVLISSEKSSANTDTGSEGRGVPAAASVGMPIGNWPRGLTGARIYSLRWLIITSNGSAPVTETT